MNSEVNQSKVTSINNKMRSYLTNPLVKILALASVLASAESARPFPTPSNPISEQALKTRGGWNPLDDLATTNAISKLGLGVGIATTLSSSSVLDKIGIENVDPICRLVARRIGGSILAFSIIAYCLHCHDISPSTAVGIACLPTIVELLKTLFDGTHKDLGFPAEGQAIVLVITIIFSYLFLGESRISKDDVLNLYSAWLVLNGILMGYLPKLACKAWGDIDADDLHALQFFVSLWGFSLLSLGALTGFLATDIMNTKAVVLGAVPFLSKIILSKLVL